MIPASRIRELHEQLGDTAAELALAAQGATLQGHADLHRHLADAQRAVAQAANSLEWAETHAPRYPLGGGA